VAQSLDFQAERAVDLLLERIESPGLPPHQESRPVELRVKSSTAPPIALNRQDRRADRSA
jgi:DNA-binding LacI/PurR family transcriptional regulator